jgi:hypothetical protein
MTIVNFTFPRKVLTVKVLTVILAVVSGLFLLLTYYNWATYYNWTTYCAYFATIYWVTYTTNRATYYN